MPGEPRGVRAARGVVRPRLAARGCGHARPRDPDPGAAAATNGRQPRARARSGGGEGWNVETSYILLDDEERT